MPSVTLANLQQSVYDTLDQNKLEFPLANVTAVINQAAYILNILTGFNQATVMAPGYSQPNQLEYPTPPGILIPTRLDIEGIEIERTSLRKIAGKSINWAVENSASYGPTSSWAPIGLQQFVIHPQDAFGGLLMEVTGVAPFTQLVNADDEINLDNQFTDILPTYSKIRLLLKEGGQPFANAMRDMPELVRKIRLMSRWGEYGYTDYWLQKILGWNSVENKGAL